VYSEAVTVVSAARRSVGPDLQRIIGWGKLGKKTWENLKRRM